MTVDHEQMYYGCGYIKVLEKYTELCYGINVTFSGDFNWKKEVHNSIIHDLVNVLPYDVSVCIHANIHYQEAVKYCYENIFRIKEIELIYGHNCDFDYVSDLPELYFSDNKFKLCLGCVKLYYLRTIVMKLKNKCIFNFMLISNIIDFNDLLLLFDFVENSDMMFFNFTFGIYREVLDTESSSGLINYFNGQSEKYDNDRIFYIIKMFYYNIDLGFLCFLQQYI
jgi:hypothetical protein